MQDSPRRRRETMRFPIRGKDVMLFSFMSEEPFRLKSLPGLDRAGRVCWSRTWKKKGLLRHLGYGLYQPTQPFFPQACRRLLDDLPKIDLDIPSPTVFAMLAELPHNYNGVERFTGGIQEVIVWRTRKLLIDRKWIHQPTKGNWDWWNPPESLPPFIAAYRRLYEAPILATTGLCIHAWGVEAAWTIGTTSGFPKVAYRGPRTLEPLDMMCLTLRAALQLPVGVAANQNLADPNMIQRMASGVSPRDLTLSRVEARIAFYGLGALLPQIRKAATELAMTGHKPSQPCVGPASNILQATAFHRVEGVQEVTWPLGQ